MEETNYDQEVHSDQKDGKVLNSPQLHVPAKKIIDRMLRNPRVFLREVLLSGKTGQYLPKLIWRLVLFSAIFGAVMGLYHNVLMAGTSAIKLPLLYVLTVLICLPSFYTTNCLFGSRLSFMQVAMAFTCASTVNAIVIASLAPVSLFFLITSGSYIFHKLLNVFFCILGGLIGIIYFIRSMRIVAETSGLSVRRGIMIIWLLLYAFVGTQLAWTIRPFFGAPGLKFELIRKGRVSNFYENLYKTIFHKKPDQN